MCSRCVLKFPSSMTKLRGGLVGVRVIPVSGTVVLINRHTGTQSECDFNSVCWASQQPATTMENLLLSDDIQVQSSCDKTATVCNS